MNNMTQSWSEGGIQLLGKTLPEENFAQVREIYAQDNFFPLEARLQLSGWIEDKFTPLVTSGGVDMMDDTGHQQMATNLATQLLQELDAKIQSTPNDPDKFLMKSKLQEISENLKQTYGNDPVALYTVVLKKLEEEMRIVAQVPVDALGAAAVGAESEIASKIRQQLVLLKQKVGETGAELDKCKTEQEQFSVEYYACRENSSRLTALQQQHGEQHQQVKALKTQKEAMEKSIRVKYSSMQNHQSQLINAFVYIYTSVKDVQVEVLDKQLIRWKRDQQLAGNGYQMNPGFLDTLQEWCEGLADIIWQLRQQVRQLENLRTKLIPDPQNKDFNLQELLASVTELLSNLVTGTFVIEKQPPQVMKTNTRFTATVRLLVGGVLNVHMAAPAVSVSIVSESQANQLLTSSSGIPKRREDYSSGDILNSQGTMEYHGATKQVSVSFR
jgi:signal transducer and activator of transcription 5B